MSLKLQKGKAAALSIYEESENRAEARVVTVQYCRGGARAWGPVNFQKLEENQCSAALHFSFSLTPFESLNIWLRSVFQRVKTRSCLNSEAVIVGHVRCVGKDFKRLSEALI